MAWLKDIFNYKTVCNMEDSTHGREKENIVHS